MNLFLRESDTHYSELWTFGRVSLQAVRLNTHTLTNTHSNGTCFSAHGAQVGEGEKKKRTGWQKLEWESVVLQLTSPKGKGCCMPLQSSGERCTRRDSAARNARLLFLVRGGNTNASRVSFKVGFTRRVFKAFLHHTRLATSQSVSIKAQLSMMFVQRLEIS